MSPVDVSIIVIARNVRDEVLTCLRSIDAHAAPMVVETILVDQGSTDGTADAVRAAHPDVRVIALDRNEGGSARNHGLRVATGRYRMFLDSDARLTPGALSELVSFMEARPEIGLVGPRLEYDDGGFQPSARRLPQVLLPILRRPPLARFFEDGPIVRRHLQLDAPRDRTREAEYVIGAAMLFSRAAQEAAGELDPKIPFAPEDIDWCVSIRQAGYRIAYHPAAVVIHSYRRTTAKKPVSREALQHLQGFAYFVWKRRRQWRALRREGNAMERRGWELLSMLLALVAALAAVASLVGTPAPASAAALTARAALVRAQVSTSADWRPYAADSPFNTPIGATRTHPRSARMVSRILSWGRPGDLVFGAAGTPDDYAHPVYFAEPGDPVVRLHDTERWGRNALEGRRIAVPAAARAAGGTDGHMTVVESDGWEYDFWQVHGGGAAGGRLRFGWGGRVRVDGSGLDGAATAANFGSLAGIIRPAELAAGRIRHALFIVLRCTSGTRAFGHGVHTGGGGSAWVYPAGKGGGTCPPGQSDGPPMGARLRLAMTPAQIAALRVPAWKRAILDALATYGGYVGDTGGTGFGVQVESGASFTSFGLPDPFVTFARSIGASAWNGRYSLDLASGVSWKRYLRVVLPPAR